MRKTYAISFAAFYLLLTTGMYVCILHCVGEYLFQPKLSITENHQEEIADDHDSKPHSHEEKSCSDDKDCSCCNLHGQYTVNENIQSPGGTFFSVLAVLITPLPFEVLFVPEKEVKLINWPKGHSPPGSIKVPLYISNRTLLI